MPIHPTPAPPIPAIAGFHIRTLCFTRGSALLLTTGLTFGGALVGAALGAIVGLIASLITGPELITKIIAVVGGALVGAGIGAAYVTIILASSMCACPPGVVGFCLGFTYTRATATWPPIAVPPFIIPRPGACTTVMPPGCP